MGAAAMAAKIKQLVPEIVYEIARERVQEALKYVQVEECNRTDTETVWALRYCPDMHRIIRAERWANPQQVRLETDEFLQEIDSLADRQADRVREVLEQTVESVAFELRAKDRRSIEWFIALAAACCVGRQGRGLVHVEDVGWLDPQSRAVLVPEPN